MEVKFTPKEESKEARRKEEEAFMNFFDLLDEIEGVFKVLFSDN